MRIPNARAIDYRIAGRGISIAVGGFAASSFGGPSRHFKPSEPVALPMAETLIGAGGWGYFSGGIEAYAKAFRFAEVNVSFCRRVPEATARRWRARAPHDFVFSLKAHHDITHADRLRASPPARAAFARDLRTARILGAPFVILETPASLAFDAEQRDGLRDLAGMVDRGTRIGLEARAYRRGSLPPSLHRTMDDGGILDVVDVSQTKPRVAADTMYTRLFGPGPHNVYEFDDDELRDIDRAGRDAVRVAFTFHGVRMYKDAARFLTFKRTGGFPAVTATRGRASLEEVLWPDARFPASRDDLLQAHGWKVLDLDDRRRAHASVLLSALPDGVFRSVSEVVRNLADESGPGTPREGRSQS